jgi:hypothetical protein
MSFAHAQPGDHKRNLAQIVVAAIRRTLGPNGRAPKAFIAHASDYLPMIVWYGSTNVTE